MSQCSNKPYFTDFFNSRCFTAMNLIIVYHAFQMTLMIAYAFIVTSIFIYYDFTSLPLLPLLFYFLLHVFNLTFSLHVFNLLFCHLYIVYIYPESACKYICYLDLEREHQTQFYYTKAIALSRHLHETVLIQYNWVQRK